MAGRRRTRTGWAAACAAALALGSAVIALPAAPRAVAAPPTGGTTIVNETFEGSSVADPSWQTLGDACLTGMADGATPPTGAAQTVDCSEHRTGGNTGAGTGGQVPPPVGTTPGYLQLTDSSGFRTGAILYNQPIAASSGISVTFEQSQYARSGGVGGDGIGFFLVDGATNLNAPGADGGSMGYAQRNTTPGVEGGYLGVGLDVYGNYFNSTENRNNGCPADQQPPAGAEGVELRNSITLRGPGAGTTGYCWQGATVNAGGSNSVTSLHGSLEGTSQSDYRTVNVQVTPASGGQQPRVIVQVQYTPGGDWVEELNVPAPAGIPGTYKFGFSASTGGSTNVHLIRNVVVQTVEPLAGLQLAKQVDRTNGTLPAVITAGTRIPYQYTVTNTGAAVLTNPTIDDPELDASATCDATVLEPAPDPASTTVCRGVHTVTADDVARGQVVNTATATATPTGGGGPVVSNPDTVTVPLTSTVSLTKSVTTPPPYSVGQSVQYGYRVTNTGDSTLSNVALTDNRVAAADLTCPANVLAPGDDVTCTGTYTVRQGDANDAGNVVNTAGVTAQTAIGQQVTDTDQASIPVFTDIGITKTVSDPTPTVGSNVTFTVTATNHGPSDATGVVVTDLLPDRLQLVTATPSQGGYAPDTGAWAVGALEDGDSATLTLVARVTTNGAVTNTAVRTATDQPDRNQANDSASVGLLPTPTTDVAVHKRVTGDTTVARGEETTFEVTASNNGPAAATAVSVVDALPAGLTFVSASGDGSYDPDTGVWTVGALAVGQSKNLTLTVEGARNGTFTNTAVLNTSTPLDSNSSNNTGTASVTVVDPVADLSITKDANVREAEVGDTVTYTVSVRNRGPNAVDGVVATDAVPTGLEITGAITEDGSIDITAHRWDIGTLETDQVATATVTAVVRNPGTLTNTVQVTAPDYVDPTPENNSASATVLASAQPLDIGVTKTAIPAGGVQLTAIPFGTQVTYVLTATNHPSGDEAVDATGLVLQDTAPPGTTYVSSDDCDGTYDPDTGRWTVGDLASGATAECRVVVTATGTGQQIDTLTLSAVDQRDTDETNNQATASIIVRRIADLGITKHVAPSVGQPGQVVAYTIAVTNDGPNTADDVVAADPLPIAADIVSATPDDGTTFDEATRTWTIGTLEPGTSVDLVVRVRLDQRTGTFVNTVAITSSSAEDPFVANNVATASLFVPAADLEVAKSVDDPTPHVGDDVTFTVGLTNWGPDEAYGVTVDDVLPDGLTYVRSSVTAGTFDPATGVWDLGDVLPVQLPRTRDVGPDQHLTIVARVDRPGTFTNTASSDRADADPFDPAPENNTASAELVATPPPVDVAVSKTVTPGEVEVGASVTYTLTVRQAGPGAADDVVLIDAFPAGVRPGTVTGADGCTLDGQNLRCALGTLAAGAGATVRVTATATAVGTHTNTAVVATSYEDGSAANDRASVPLVVRAATPAPPVTPTPSPTTTAPVTPGPSPTAGPSSPGGPTSPAPAPGGLAVTGADVLTVAVVVVVLLLVGLGLTVLSRRRRRGED